MPTAWDRSRKHTNDKDPNRVLDFNDLDATAYEAGLQIRDFIPRIIYELTGINVTSWDAFIESLNDGKGIDLPGLDGIVAGLQTAFNQLGDILNGLVVTPINAAVGFFKDWFDRLGANLRNIFDANPNEISFNLSDVNILAPVQAVTNVVVGMFNGWFGGGGTGAPEEAAIVMAAIKTSIAGGYTLETLTTSGTWDRPADPEMIAEFYCICIGSGGKALAGGVSNGAASEPTPGGEGGNPGGYVAQDINPFDLDEHIAYVIAAGSTSSIDGSASTFGTLVSSTNDSAGIGHLLGYLDAAPARPGKGGTGGVAGQDGKQGGSTPLAAGGLGGTGRFTSSLSNVNGDPGLAGGNADLTGSTRAGGGGGGGGGGARTSSLGYADAKDGGVGGWPGGGGGGGGRARHNGGGGSGGSGGNGANGAIVLIYKLIEEIP